MMELLEYSFATINIIPTALLIFILLYWLIVMLGFIGSDAIDVDLDLDVDADVDVDVEVDTDVDVDGGVHVGGPGIFVSALDFFNVGRVPLMILLTFITLPLWFIALNVNDFFGITTFAIAFALFVPELFLSMMLAKFMTAPIAKMFKNIDDETGVSRDFTGAIAVVRIQVDERNDGQIETENRGANVLLTARSTKGVLKAGDKVLIIDYNEKEEYYLVEIFN